VESLEQERAATDPQKAQNCSPTLAERTAIRYGPFEANLSKEVVTHNGSRLKLAGKPYQLLLALLENPGKVVTRAAIRDRLWSDPPVDWNSNLNTTVNKVRQALGNSPCDSFCIETIPRKGYLLIPKPQFSKKRATETAPDAIHPNVSDGSHPSAQSPARASLFWSVPRVITFIVFGMLVGAGMMALWFDVTLKSHLGAK
jgi:DNA-binding winged helix-turn-helix (wHTH) protein